MVDKIPAVILVGYTCSPIENLWDQVEEPRAPSNYGEEAAAKWQREKGDAAMAKLVAEAKFAKHIGELTRIVAVDPQEQLVFDSHNNEEEAPAIDFATWLFSRYHGAFPHYLRDTSRRGVALFGFHAKEFTRLVGVSCADLGRPVPVGFWQLNEDCFDPFDKHVEASWRDRFPLQSLLRKYGIDTGESYEPHVDPYLDLQVTAELIRRGQLVVAVNNEGLQELIMTHLPVTPPQDPGAEDEYEEVEVEVEVPIEEETEPAKAETSKPKKKKVKRRRPAPAS